MFAVTLSVGPVFTQVANTRAQTFSKNFRETCCFQRKVSFPLKPISAWDVFSKSRLKTLMTEISNLLTDSSSRKNKTLKNKNKIKNIKGTLL